MAKNKFKVGDIVKSNCSDGIKKAEVIVIFDERRVVIKILEHDSMYAIGMINVVLSKDYEKIADETIVIYRKDNKVVALDKSTGEKAEARCHPVDKFDFHAGAERAFDRLMGEPDKKEEIPKAFLENAKQASYIVAAYERAGFTHEEAVKILEAIISKGVE